MISTKTAVERQLSFLFKGCAFRAIMQRIARRFQLRTYAHSVTLVAYKA